MYNKISTTIAGKESPTPSASNGTNGSEKTKSDKKKNDQKNRESAIWWVKNLRKIANDVHEFSQLSRYEYGCV